jgi:fibrillarin-like rRNA methylase
METGGHYLARATAGALLGSGIGVLVWARQWTASRSKLIAALSAGQLAFAILVASLSAGRGTMGTLVAAMVVAAAIYWGVSRSARSD